MPGPAPLVSLELPALLRPAAGWTRLRVRGGTVGQALDAAFEKTPTLRHHLMAEGELRPHILCVVNDTVLPRRGLLATGLQEGDEILIHQAISGG